MVYRTHVDSHVYTFIDNFTTQVKRSDDYDIIAHNALPQILYMVLYNIEIS